MAEINLEELLTNREAYPDDREVVIGEQKVTLKELRDRLIPKGEFTRATQRAAELERLARQRDEELRQAQLSLAQVLQARENAGQQTPTTPSGEVDWQVLQNDPLLRPLVQRLEAAQRVAEAAAKRLEQAEARLAQHEQTYIADRYLQTLERLAQDHPNLDRQQVLAKAAEIGQQWQQYGPDLRHVVTLLTHEDAVKQAREQGYHEGLSKGKEEARLPYLPGTTRAPVAPQPSPFQSLDELEDAAARDPDILRQFYGDSS